MRGSGESTDEGQRSAAVRTAARRLARGIVVGRTGADLQPERGRQRLWQTLVYGLCGELLLQDCERLAGVGMQEAGGADFLEPFGQHMLQETLHETHDVECHGGPGLRARLVAKGDLSLVECHQSPVREGHAGDVGGEICQGRASVPH